LTNGIIIIGATHALIAIGVMPTFLALPSSP
jgi:hypothetical protein